MIRLLWTRTVGMISIRAFYILWIRASVLAAVVWAVVLTAGDSWIAQTGLTFILLVLLVGGITLLAFGIRDLIRDFRHFLRMRSEKNSHAPL